MLHSVALKMGHPVLFMFIYVLSNHFNEIKL